MWPCWAYAGLGAWASKGHDVEGKQVGDEAGDVAGSGTADPDRVAAVAPAAVELDQVRAGGVVGQLPGLFVSEAGLPGLVGQGRGGRGQPVPLSTPKPKKPPSGSVLGSFPARSAISQLSTGPSLTQTLTAASAGPEPLSQRKRDSTTG